MVRTRKPALSPRKIEGRILMTKYPTSTVVKLNDISQNTGVPVSEICRRAVVAYIKRWEAEQPVALI